MQPPSRRVPPTNMLPPISIFTTKPTAMTVELRICAHYRPPSTINHTPRIETQTASVYQVSWLDWIDAPSDYNRARFDAVFQMDPNTETVNVTVSQDTNVASAYPNPTAWGLAFPDLADVVYYANNPIDMVADYSILLGYQDNAYCTYAHSAPLSEWRVPVNGATCQLRTDQTATSWPRCLQRLPDTTTNLLHLESSGVFTWTFDVPFKVCGYHFNPAEFQTCRPLTMTSATVYQNGYGFNCLGVFDIPTSLGQLQHAYGTIQIDDFPTSEPTTSPTADPTWSPTTPPTDAPSSSPTYAPVNPTVSPTFPTNAPTTAPTGSPTQRPTDLPTVNFTIYDEPPCPGLWVKHLDVMFPKEQAIERFNQVYNNKSSKSPKIHNQRRVWSNGVLDIHFSTRFGDFGDWIITNTSYSAISLEDANDNNSLVYDTPVPDAVSPNSLPGPYPNGFIYYDHFPHDNIFSKPDAATTLYFECLNTEYPTTEPSPAPTTEDPTVSPTTAAPTLAPTANCTGLCIQALQTDACDGLADQFIGCYLKGKDTTGGKARWSGVAEVTGYDIHYSDWHQQWTIDGPDYAAVNDGSQRQPPGYDDEIPYPAQVYGEWYLFDKTNLVAIPCEFSFKYFCSGTGIPTEAPTESPTTASPTTAAPTTAPTLAPSLAPSVAPTLAPSYSPTDSPTAAPVVECLGLELSGTDSALDGLYRRESDFRNSHFWWTQNVGGDGEIFWSDSILHESWIVHSEDLGLIWLSQKRPQEQPALVGLWDKYIGSLPFVEDTQTLTFICYGTLPPTKEPTPAPSLAPSFSPTLTPTNAPSAAPSLAPSLAPTNSPTPAPTTQSPTMEPTTEPTYDPTREPTPEACLYLLVVNGNASDTDIDTYEFPGLYEYDFTDDAWVKDSATKIVLRRNESASTWSITRYSLIQGTFYPEKELEIFGDRLRPPYAGVDWTFTDDGTNIPHTLFIDCANTSAPTAAPSLAPSLAPTGAPTSSCRGLYFNNTANDAFPFNTWFSRQDDYYINGHKYWISNGDDAEIKYTRGNWYLFEKDNDIDDEDPVMLTLGGSMLLSPPSGDWIYVASAGYGAGIAHVDILCDATSVPSMSPTTRPSAAPTDYVPMSWQYCPDSVLYFGLISNVSTSVYWPMPIVNDHLYDIDMSVTPNVTAGNELPLGENLITYTAMDTYNRSIECNVSVMVIGGLYFTDIYDLCKRHKFNVELQFNTSYQVLPSGQEVAQDAMVTSYNAYIYDPEMVKDEQNCYVTAEQISQYAAIEIINEPGKSTFLGLEAVNVVWEILVLLLILCLVALIIECLYRIYRERKEAQDAKDNEQTENLLASQALNEEDQKQPDVAEEREEEEAAAVKTENTEVELQEAPKPAQAQEQEPVADEEVPPNIRPNSTAL